MPYIDLHSRAALDGGAKPETPGEVAYVTYRAMLQAAGPKPNFLSHAMVIGAVICALLEYYRRVLAPYEDAKMVENGDVCGSCPHPKEPTT